MIGGGLLPQRHRRKRRFRGISWELSLGACLDGSATADMLVYVDAGIEIGGLPLDHGGRKRTSRERKLFI